MSKMQLVACGLFAATLLVCLSGASDAQKTAQRWSSSSGSRPQSVYGGYQQQQSSSDEQQRLVVPANSGGRVQQSTSWQSSSSQQARPARPVYQQQESSGAYESSASEAAEADAEPASYGAVQGQPGRDFPNYTRVPKTSFKCDGLPYEYGMYADEETGCQAYHMCYNGRKESFLCGPGTVFNQRILHCDYWYSVDCAKSSQYYSSNAYMGSSQPEPGPAEASGSDSSYSQQQTSYNSRPAARPKAPSGYGAQQAASSWSFNKQSQQTQESY